MSDAEKIPLTEKETEAFQTIKSMIQDKAPVCLMRIVIDDKPEAAICVVASTDDEDQVDIIPLAVMVSDELFRKIDTPEGSTEVTSADMIPVATLIGDELTRNKEKN